jgi:hypothetical protein
MFVKIGLGVVNSEFVKCIRPEGEKEILVFFTENGTSKIVFDSEKSRDEELERTFNDLCCPEEVEREEESDEEEAPREDL